MSQLALLSGFAGLLSAAAIFGFFYAWVCSTMWGLDTVSSRVAIEAMQAMNASVRNAVFGPVFFGTGPILLLTALLAWMSAGRSAAIVFALAGVIYIAGGMMLTMMMHVPMNETLATVDLNMGSEQLDQIWSQYSPDWQFWNQVRAAFCGLVVLLSGWGLVLMARVSI